MRVRTGMRVILHYARSGAWHDVIQVLIEYGACVNAGVPGKSPLTDAAWFGDARVFEMLVEAGADTESFEHSLRYAIRGDNKPLARALLEQGCEIETLEWNSPSVRIATICSTCSSSTAGICSQQQNPEVRCSSGCGRFHSPIDS